MLTVYVHGFQFDGTFGGPDGSEKFFREHRDWLGTPVGLSKTYNYYSYPAGIKSQWKAWRQGYILRPLSATYRAAYDKAGYEGVGLAHFCDMRSRIYNQPVRIVAHSLGTRVALSSLKYQSKGVVAQIVLMNGAEKAGVAREALENLDDSTRILNLSVGTDDVLRKLGSYFATGRNDVCIGNGGLDGAEHPQWTNIQLDDEDTQEDMRDRFGIEIEGDNPDKYLDHWYIPKVLDNAMLVQLWANERL